VSLHRCSIGSSYRVRRVVGDRVHRRRLTELGFFPGAVMSVTGKGSMGGLILALGDARVAIDARTAATLAVEPMHG
jgi:ferrous iron transport protein A